MRNWLKNLLFGFAIAAALLPANRPTLREYARAFLIGGLCGCFAVLTIQAFSLSPLLSAVVGAIAITIANILREEEK